MLTPVPFHRRLVVGFGAMAPRLLLCCYFRFARQDLLEGVWFSWGGAVQGVLVVVFEGGGLAADLERGVDFVAPGVVAGEGDVELVAVGAERVFEECGGADAVFGLAAGCDDGQVIVAGTGVAGCQGGLAAWQGQGL